MFPFFLKCGIILNGDHMKKKIFSLILIFILFLSLSSCTLLNQANCEHEYEEKIVEPTCVTNGTNTKVCKKCGHTVREPILAGGHKYGEFEIKEEATCSKEGSKERKCEYCGNVEKEIIPKTPHDYDVVITSPTCTEDGFSTKTCKKCKDEIIEDYVDALGHDFGEWIVTEEATESKNGSKYHECKRCHYKEVEEIVLLNYVNIDLIKFNFEKDKKYDANNIFDLSLIYNSALFNRANEFTCTLNFEFDFNELAEKLSQMCDIPYDYKVDFSLLGKDLTCRFNITGDPILKASLEDVYTQYDSLNYIKYNSNRSDTFDDFKINTAKYSYNVSTSSQLVYVLERASKPIVKSGSEAETVYNKAKEILREIVDDRMTNVEKVKAIHDYLVLNICYDGALYNKMFEASDDLKQYRGFFLEGALLDNRAVCEGISKAMCVLCNIEGIPCVCVTGYQTANPNGAGHAWNKVLIDSKWYVIDATSDGTIINGKYEILSYKYFLISESKMHTLYTENDYKDIICSNNYDYFKEFKFDSTNDFDAENLDELVDILKYFDTYKGTNATIQFRLSYSNNFSEEINNAFHKIGKSASYTFAQNGDNVYTLTK